MTSESAPEGLDWFRDLGWSVAVHNDYRQNGNSYTFYLLTHPCGRWVKGEGLTDEQALEEAKRAVVAASTPAPGQQPDLTTAEGNEGVGESFQERVHPWMLECFGAAIAADRVERGDRLVEEVFELLQSGGYDRQRVVALIDYVWGREPGDPHQETGGVMVTLAAYCLAHGIDMHQAAEDELARIWTKVEKIRAKQAAKPTGSALPIAASSEGRRAPASHRPEREALIAAVNAALVEKHGTLFDVGETAVSAILASGHVTPSAHAAALRKAWEAGRDAMKAWMIARCEFAAARTASKPYLHAMQNMIRDVNEAVITPPEDRP